MDEFFDVVFVADPRFPGGTSTALEAEIRAAAGSGLSVAMLPVKGTVLRQSWPVHPGLAAAVSDGDVAWLEPGRRARATFAIVHHPGLFEGAPARGLELSAETVVLVLHHPLRDGSGVPQYPLEAIVANVEAAIGRKPILAPVGPKVRAQMETAAIGGASVCPEDWLNLIDVDAWPQRPDRPLAAPIRVGRHSRPHPPKWPGTLASALAAYPQREDLSIVMLGAARDRLQRTWGSVPAHWQLLPFGSVDVRDFLRSLDFYVYFHSPQWIEAFGRSILEAAATGLVVILPEHFRPLFGAAAVYGEPDEVGDLIDEFAADPARYRAQAARARAVVAERFGHRQFRPRLERLRPDWAALSGGRPPLSRRRPEPAQRRALLVTSNGVGLGHLTRLLAVADALPPELEPVFFTLSQAAGLVREAGYCVEYRPFHRTTGADVAAWNAALAEELSDALAFHGADCLVFDGNVPYQGLLDALDAHPHVVSIWMRRAFWNDGHAAMLERAAHFDAVVEPQDLAASLDVGPTVRLRETVHLVPPIVRGDPAARLEPLAARRLLGLPETGTLALLALGPQSNFDLTPVREAILAWFAGRPDLHLVELEPWIGAASGQSEAPRRISRYPIFPLSRAFDFQISTCGYNTFHEAVLGGIPSVIVPNEAAEMDLQVERARFGELRGCSLMLRRNAALDAPRILDRIARPQERAAMRAAAAELAVPDGAACAAAFISDYARLRKVQVPPSAAQSKGA